MNWDAFAAIASLVSAIAVVISLLYLAVQIRISSRINRATIRGELSRSAQSLQFTAMEHSEPLVKTIAGNKLTDREQFEVSMLNRARFRGYENFVYQRKLGLFNESEWNGILVAIRSSMAMPYIQNDWREVRDQYSDSMRNTIDPMVSDITD